MFRFLSDSATHRDYKDWLLSYSKRVERHFLSFRWFLSQSNWFEMLIQSSSWTADPEFLSKRTARGHGCSIIDRLVLLCKFNIVISLTLRNRGFHCLLIRHYEPPKIHYCNFVTHRLHWVRILPMRFLRLQPAEPITYNRWTRNLRDYYLLTKH